MTIRGLNRIRRGVNFILNQVRGRAAILLYHRIADHVPDPQLLCVSPDNFAEHIGQITKRYNVMSLAALASAMNNGRIPKRTIVLTFDDGYVDNFWHARPILEQHACPATVFVVSGYVGKNQELPSDELERILLLSPDLPRSFSLTVGDQTCCWELGEERPQGVETWNIEQDVLKNSRQGCYQGLHRLLKPLGQSQREEGLRLLLKWANVSPSYRRDRRIMNTSELAEIAKAGLIDVGAHSVHHLFLATQPISEQREEIFQSRKVLEKTLGRPVSAFAYPYGNKASMTAETVSLVREAGFSIACANVPGLVQAGSDSFLLPRYLVRNWSGEELVRRVDRFFRDQ